MYILFLILFLFISNVYASNIIGNDINISNKRYAPISRNIWTLTKTHKYQIGSVSIMLPSRLESYAHYASSGKSFRLWAYSENADGSYLGIKMNSCNGSWQIVQFQNLNNPDNPNTIPFPIWNISASKATIMLSPIQILNNNSQKRMVFAATKEIDSSNLGFEIVYENETTHLIEHKSEKITKTNLNLFYPEPITDGENYINDMSTPHRVLHTKNSNDPPIKPIEISCTKNTCYYIAIDENNPATFDIYKPSGDNGLDLYQAINGYFIDASSSLNKLTVLYYDNINKKYIAKFSQVCPLGNYPCINGQCIAQGNCTSQQQQPICKGAYTLSGSGVVSTSGSCSTSPGGECCFHPYNIQLLLSCFQFDTNCILKKAQNSFASILLNVPPGEKYCQTAVVPSNSSNIIITECYLNESIFTTNYTCGLNNQSYSSLSACQSACSQTALCTSSEAEIPSAAIAVASSDNVDSFLLTQTTDSGNSVIYVWPLDKEITLDFKVKKMCMTDQALYLLSDQGILYRMNISETGLDSDSESELTNNVYDMDCAKHNDEIIILKRNYLIYKSQGGNVQLYKQINYASNEEPIKVFAATNDQEQNLFFVETILK